MAVSLPSEALHARIPDSPAGEVALWLVDLDATPDGARGLLSAAERARGARIVCVRRRRRWERSRGALRALLARQLDADPAELKLTLGPWGKPALAGASEAKDMGLTGGRGPRFSLSHSHGLLLVAVSEQAEVGVDVERLRAGRTRDFLRAWTLREARVKCLGMGLLPRGERCDGQGSTPPWWGELDAGPGLLGAAPALGGEGESARMHGAEIDAGPAIVAALAWRD